MQLNTLVNLIENEENIELLVTSSVHGFVMCIFDEDQPLNLDKNSYDYLELCRGGRREFATLDAVYKVTRKYLHRKKFTVI